MKNNLEKLLNQKAEIERQIAKEAKDQVNFSVDAGIVNRLGKELVGRAETAVSELVKNAYDADANNVELNFINTDDKGGTLVIQDDGHGMGRDGLIKGFMRLSSPDKLHNPVSPHYKRVRAGKKGIGRFAAQRLGHYLTIITKIKGADKGLKIEIDWTKYEIDKNLGSIYNPISEIETEEKYGTKLIIRNLFEAWTDAQIKRVFRYVSDLLQPDYLSDRSQGLNINGETLKIASQSDGTFKVSCFKTVNNEKQSIINEDLMMFDRAVAIIEGYVDDDKDGYCAVKSKKFNIDDFAIPIGAGTKPSEISKKWSLISNVYFKAYYYIYNRPEYYISMTKMELNKINELTERVGSIRLYRNGFRVLPYGEPYNDWLKLDSKGGSRRKLNAPFANKNFFGFVEVIDPEGVLFEETASREGLLENKALEELRNFVFKSLAKGRDLVAEAIKKEKDEKNIKEREVVVDDKSTDELLDDLVGIFTKKETNEEGKKQDDKLKKTKEFKTKVEQIKKDFKRALDEISMLRIWAGLGLSIGEFTHDVTQFSSAIFGYLVALENQKLNKEGVDILSNIESIVKSFKAYIAFFDTGASKAESRNLKHINLVVLVSKFINIVKEESKDAKVIVEEPEVYDGYDHKTILMHESEWFSILFNLYSNAKKAIIRAGRQGRIKIIIGKEKDNLYLEFLDNGDGVPKEYEDRIFNAFFSTSNPAGLEASENEELTGRGLGLKIVKDTLQAYQGSIYLMDSPDKDFNTCFRIEIPAFIEE